MPEYKIILTFVKDDGATANIIVHEADSAATDAEVKTCMEAILTQDIFNINGQDLASIMDAELVATTTTAYALPA